MVCSLESWRLHVSTDLSDFSSLPGRGYQYKSCLMLLGSPDEEKGNEYSDARCNFGRNTGCSEWVESVAKAYSRFENAGRLLERDPFSGTLVDERIMAMEGERNECFS